MIKQFIRTFIDLTSSRITCSRAFLMLIITNDTRNILLRFKHFAKILLHTINYPPKILESFTFFRLFSYPYAFLILFSYFKNSYENRSFSLYYVVSCFDRFLVTNRATRLDDSLDTSLSNFFHIIRKWEESI